MKKSLIMETLNGYIYINALSYCIDVKNSSSFIKDIFVQSIVNNTYTHESIFSLHSNFTTSQEPQIF